MNKQLIRELAVTGGIYDCICDPYDKLKNGDPYSSVMIDLERFAEKIAYECIDLALGSSHREDDMGAIIANKIRKHFGVEE
jgi:hypothetical protein